MSIKDAKAARLVEANKLIKIISTYGRRFFYNAKHNRVAEMKIAPSGHIYIIDDYTGKAVYTAYRGHWNGFSHGGTLRDLIQTLANYIRTGERLSINWIGPERMRSTDGNIWGYAPDEMEKCRAEAFTCDAIRPLEEKEAA